MYYEDSTQSCEIKEYDASKSSKNNVCLKENKQVYDKHSSDAKMLRKSPRKQLQLKAQRRTSPCKSSKNHSNVTLKEEELLNQSISYRRSSSNPFKKRNVSEKKKLSYKLNSSKKIM